MEGIWELATKISTPLMLGGLIIIAMFFIFRLILSQNFIPQLTKALGGKVILTIIYVLFVLALIGVILGFVGFVISKYYPTLSSQYVNVGTDEDKPLFLVVGALAKVRNVTVNFNQNCPESVQKAKIEAGNHEGGDVKTFLENLKQRVRGESINYTVKQEGEGRYEIICQ